MTCLKKCKNCRSAYEEWSHHHKFKYPFNVWCVNCINEHFNKKEDEQEKILKYEIKNKPSFLTRIDWNDEKNAIIAIFIIILVLGLLISLKRDYGEKDYYPVDRPIDSAW